MGGGGGGRETADGEKGWLLESEGGETWKGDLGGGDERAGGIMWAGRGKGEWRGGRVWSRGR